jgi:hypothetical protein
VRNASREEVGGVDDVDEFAPELVSLMKLAVFVCYVDDGAERAPGKERSALPRSVSTLVQGERPLEEPQGLVTRTEYLVGRGVNLGELQNLGSGFQGNGLRSRHNGAPCFVVQFAARHQFPGYQGDSLGPIYVAGRSSPERRSHPWKNE